VLVRFRIGTGPDLVHHLNVVIQDGSDDGDHIGFNDSGTHALRAPYSNVDNALESEAPFPHLHQILTPALLQDAHQPFNAAIDGEDISNPSR
jgi:hypothetical protein